MVRGDGRERHISYLRRATGAVYAHLFQNSCAALFASLNVRINRRNKCARRGIETDVTPRSIATTGNDLRRSTRLHFIRRLRTTRGVSRLATYGSARTSIKQPIWPAAHIVEEGGLTCRRQAAGGALTTDEPNGYLIATLIIIARALCFFADASRATLPTPRPSRLPTPPPWLTPPLRQSSTSLSKSSTTFVGGNCGAATHI